MNLRPYRKTRRAELKAETRLRITESAVELHGTVGPARTTMSAIAERAGVRRSTLYRHFPDEASGSSTRARRAGGPRTRRQISRRGRRWTDPDERLGVALAELYAFYGRSPPMYENLLRDEAVVDVVRERLAAFAAGTSTPRVTCSWPAT